MKIKILKNKSTPTHSLVKDMVVDLRSSDAEALIKEGVAKKATAAEIKTATGGNKDG